MLPATRGRQRRCGFTFECSHVADGDNKEKNTGSVMLLNQYSYSD